MREIFSIVEGNQQVTIQKVILQQVVVFLAQSPAFSRYDDNVGKKRKVKLMATQEYMQDFMEVFSTLERWGPGSDTETLRALTMLPLIPGHNDTILEVGCGKGLATEVLVKHTEAMITATDTEDSALESLNHKFTEMALSLRLKTVNADMANLPFDEHAFSLIWAEASAYVMGVENALAAWRPLLKRNSYLVFSDLVLTSESPSQACLDYWQKEYPDIQTAERRRTQIQNQGYKILGDFQFEKASWDNYYLPLQKRVLELKFSKPDSQALADIEREIDFYFNHCEEFGYQMFVLGT